MKSKVIKTPLTKVELNTLAKALEVLLEKQAQDKVSLKVFSRTISLLYKVRGELVHISN